MPLHWCCCCNLVPESSFPDLRTSPGGCRGQMLVSSASSSQASLEAWNSQRRLFLVPPHPEQIPNVAMALWHISWRCSPRTVLSFPATSLSDVRFLILRPPLKNFWIQDTSPPPTPSMLLPSSLHSFTGGKWRQWSKVTSSHSELFPTRHPVPSMLPLKCTLFGQ